MAVVIPSKSADAHFSISHIISKFRAKKRAGKNGKEKRGGSHGVEVLDTRPPLIPAPLPLVLPVHQQTLANLGWTTVTFPESPSENISKATTEPSSTSPSDSTPPLPHPLQTAYTSLLAASRAFFALPPSEKQQYKHTLGSEEGWSHIPGEKEFITLRTLQNCPDVLREPAKAVWDLMGAHLSCTLGRISTSLGLPDTPDGGLRQFVGPCGVMPVSDSEKTATMLRLFRYEGSEAKVVAEAHADLGLLSAVVGDVPGLEVWDGQGWFDVEREVERAGRRGASLLGGRQLERLSNGRFPAGGHRVVAYGLQEPTSTQVSKMETAETAEQMEMEVPKRPYRFSIVFVLRAHEPLLIHSDTLETPITGKWEKPMNGVTAGEFYAEIRGKHFNINVDVGEREKQRRKIRVGKEKDGDGKDDGDGKGGGYS